MHQRILEEIRNKIRLRKYIMTLQAEEEMNDVLFQVKLLRGKKTEILVKENIWLKVNQFLPEKSYLL